MFVVVHLIPMFCILPRTSRARESRHPFRRRSRTGRGLGGRIPLHHMAAGRYRQRKGEAAVVVVSSKWNTKYTSCMFYACEDFFEFLRRSPPVSQQSDSERLCTIILQGGATSAKRQTIGSTVSARPQAVQGTVWTPNKQAQLEAF